MKKRTGMNIGIIAVSLLCCGFLFLAKPVETITTDFATVAGSYAGEYVEKNKLEQVELTDDLKFYFDLRYETFDYMETDGGLTLTGYRGIGERVVVPAEIGGVPVTAVAGSFWEHSETITELVLPKTIISMEWKEGTAVTLYCYEGTPFLSQENAVFDEEKSETDKTVMKEETAVEEDTISNEETAEDSAEDNSVRIPNGNIQLMNDSEPVNFDLGEIPFHYNETETEVEIVFYQGKDNRLIVPSYINGKPVTVVSIPAMYEYDLVVFPDTVTEITGDILKTTYSPEFIMELCFIFLSMLLALVTLNLLLPERNEDYALNAPQMILSIFHLAFQLLFGVVLVFQGILPLVPAGMLQAGIVVLYVLLLLLGGRGKQHAVEINEKIADKTSFMKEIKLFSKQLSLGITEKEIKKRLDRLEEDIRYSDAVTGVATMELEEQLKESIQRLKSIISVGDREEILEQCERTEQILRMRNEKCKAEK